MSVHAWGGGRFIPGPDGRVAGGLRGLRGGNLRIGPQEDVVGGLCLRGVRASGPLGLRALYRAMLRGREDLDKPWRIHPQQELGPRPEDDACGHQVLCKEAVGHPPTVVGGEAHLVEGVLHAEVAPPVLGAPAAIPLVVRDYAPYQLVLPTGGVSRARGLVAWHAAAREGRLIPRGRAAWTWRRGRQPQGAVQGGWARSPGGRVSLGRRRSSRPRARARACPRPWA